MSQEIVNQVQDHIKSDPFLGPIQELIVVDIIANLILYDGDTKAISRLKFISESTASSIKKRYFDNQKIDIAVVKESIIKNSKVNGVESDINHIAKLIRLTYLLSGEDDFLSSLQSIANLSKNTKELLHQS